MQLTRNFVLNSKQTVILYVDYSLTENLHGFGINQLVCDPQVVAISNETSGEESIYFEICCNFLKIYGRPSIFLNRRRRANTERVHIG